jgi:hypothetical protein
MGSTSSDLVEAIREQLYIANLLHVAALSTPPSSAVLRDEAYERLLESDTEGHSSQSLQTRRRMSDALSAEIATIYRDAWEAGDNPTQAVAHYYQKPYSTASRWVGEARKRGHLGPADGPRGGEASRGGAR